MNGLDMKINKLMLALRTKNRIVILSKPEFYSYKFEKVMKKYEFKEMTRLEVELRKQVRDLNFKISELKKMLNENVVEEDLVESICETIGRSQERVSFLKAEIKEIKLNPIEFLNKKDLLLFLVDTLKNGDPNE